MNRKCSNLATADALSNNRGKEWTKEMGKKERKLRNNKNIEKRDVHPCVYSIAASGMRILREIKSESKGRWEVEEMVTRNSSLPSRGS